MDSDILTPTNKPDTMMSVIADGMQGIEIKFICLLFLVYLIIHSDIFVEKILSKTPGATYLKYPTTYGTIVQGLLTCGSAAVIQSLIKTNII